MDFGRTYFDWETRGGPPVPIPIGQSWNVSFNTDERKWWEINPYFGAGDTWDGQFYMSRLWVNLKPRSNVELSLGPGYRQEWDVSRWLKASEDGDGNRMDIFGEQDLCQFDMTLRGTFTFTRDLTLQVYAQPFIAAVDYNNFKRLLPDEHLRARGRDRVRRGGRAAGLQLEVLQLQRDAPLGVPAGQHALPGVDPGEGRRPTAWATSSSTATSRDLFDTVPGNTFLVKVELQTQPVTWLRAGEAGRRLAGGAGVSTAVRSAPWTGRRDRPAPSRSWPWGRA